MPNDSFLPGPDTELTQWLTNFNSVAAANMTTLKLTQADLNPIQDNSQDFIESIGTADAARQTAKNATNVKKGKRELATGDARALARRIQNTVGIPDALKQQLGLTVPGPRRRVVPIYTPQKLQAAIQPQGQILLTWEAGGNEAGTLYRVERKCGETGEWAVVDSVTPLRLLDVGCTPGVKTFYRVCAKRSSRVSLASGEIAVY